jgi:Tfp pilus assembly protein PilF
MIPQLEKLLGTPRDGALLRYSLGLEYAKSGDHARAAQYLRDAVERDPRGKCWERAWPKLSAMKKRWRRTGKASPPRRKKATARPKKK